MISPSTITIPQGSAGTVVIQSALVSGAPQSIVLTVAPLPSGVNAQFVPPVVPSTPPGAAALAYQSPFTPIAPLSSLPPMSAGQIPAGNAAVLTIAVGNTPIGTYNLTVTAQGSLGVQHTAALTLIVTASDFSI